MIGETNYVVRNFRIRRCWWRAASPAWPPMWAVAEPTLVGRVVAAWPSFALTASYELWTRQVRRRAADMGTRD